MCAYRFLTLQLRNGRRGQVRRRQLMDLRPPVSRRRPLPCVLDLATGLERRVPTNQRRRRLSPERARPVVLFF